MTFSFPEINFWAVLVCAVASFMVGGVWYGLVFAKTWVSVHGFSEDQVASMAKKQGRNFAIFFATDLVMATVISMLAVNLGGASAVQGAALGLLIWVGVSATTVAAKNAACNKSLSAYLIDCGHELAALLVMGAIIGAWR